jgi:hypothetical protein
MNVLVAGSLTSTTDRQTRRPEVPAEESIAALISGRMCSEGVHVALQKYKLLCLGTAQNCCEKETILVASSCLSVRWYERDPIERTVMKLSVRGFLLRIVDTLGLL